MMALFAQRHWWRTSPWAMEMVCIDPSYTPHRVPAQKMGHAEKETSHEAAHTIGIGETGHAGGAEAGGMGCIATSLPRPAWIWAALDPSSTWLVSRVIPSSWPALVEDLAAQRHTGHVAYGVARPRRMWSIESNRGSRSTGMWGIVSEWRVEA